MSGTNPLMQEATKNADDDIGSTETSAVNTNTQYTNYHWRHALISFGLLWLVALVLYWETAASIVAIWIRSETYAHGFLIVPISVYLVWQRRKQLRQMVPVPNLMALPVLAVSLLLWLAAWVAEVQLIQQLVFVSLIPILVVLLLGSAVARAMMFPLGYLIFAVPFGEFLVAPLQDQTAWFAVQALILSGIPVYWEGLYLTIPGGNFVVAEGCSGIRYLIASIALSSIYAYMTYRSYWKRTGFILLGIIVPIVANGIRAFSIVMIAYLSDMRIATGVDHILYGWVFFGIVMLLLFWFGSFWREEPIDDSSVLKKPQAGTVVPSSKNNYQMIIASTFAIIFLASGTYASSLLSASSAVTGQEVRLELPKSSGVWTGPTASDDAWQPSYIGADKTVYQQYQNQAETVYFYVAYYGNQDNGKELVGSLNRVYDQEQWRRVQDNSVSVIMPSGKNVAVAETDIRSADKRRIVWHWYNINGAVTASRVMAKMLESWERLRNHKVDAMLVVVARDYTIDPQEARNDLRNFLENVGADIVVVNENVGTEEVSIVAPDQQ
ncbi:MAG: exosortase A [Gammaproteobacteria bacterium]|nr:exosortase A [Gammaproteobacteria bacterium]MCF6259245.1 exosortase A [Gammaproteobacteria bacterium]